MLNRIIQVQSPNPDDARRRRLLNILLIGIFVSAIIGLLITGYGVFTELWGLSEIFLRTVACLVFIIGVSIIYVINKRSGKIAIYLFILLLITAYIISDTPYQISDGRSVFYFSIPIVIASLLIHPLASFALAAIGCMIITWAASTISQIPDFIVMIGFFMLALVSWLTLSSLEQALKRLREINANLDRLVAERTKALAESLARERIEAGRSIAILESIADGVIVFDLHGKAIVANPATTQLLSLPRDQIINSSIDDLIHSRTLDNKNRSVLGDLLTNPSQQPASYRVQWGTKTFSVSSAQVFDTEKTRIGRVAVFRDFTHEAEIEKVKDTILATVSHELRTPLNAILGYVEMLKEAVYGPINAKQARASERIISNTRRLLSIVSDLLDQAQIEAGKMIIQVQPFKTAELLDNVHNLMIKAANEKGLTLTSESAPGFPETLYGDSARLQQVLLNLVGNAIKFTVRGSVHIRLSCPDEKHWAMEVRDSGMGIPETELARIFEPFKQVDDSITRKQAGFGLGLSIVKQLVSLMDGDIAVNSKMGVGSVFTVTLPIVQTGGIQHE